ncbi:hypothetical protein AAG747_06520 [Rapidithrix thailandica]|uniref:Lipoprotein n=1 Tax=Rapidithrix thailandica TaxID=413964 RepID=A0AAW9SA17_9BACT
MKNNHINRILFTIITLLVIAFSQGCTQPSIPFTYQNFQEWDSTTVQVLKKCSGPPNLFIPFLDIRDEESREKVLEVIANKNLAFKKGSNVYVLEIDGMGTHYRIKMWQKNEDHYYKISLFGEKADFEKVLDPEFHSQLLSLYENKNPCTNDNDGVEIIKGMSCLTTFEYDDKSDSYHIKSIKAIIR